MVFTFNFTTAYDQPYRTETSALTTLVPPPAPFQVSIGGHSYAVDTEFKPYLRDAFRHRSIASQREAIDLTNEPGEGTVNVEDLWRRGQNNWVLGQGQPYLDRKESSPNRFWASKGITTGYTWQLTLLPKARHIYPTDSEFVKVICVGDTMYVADGNVVKFSTNLTTWTEVTGAPSGDEIDLFDWATNGHTLWMAWNAGGIYKTVAGTAAMTLYCGGNVTSVGWAGTYLMAGSGPSLYGGGGTHSIVGPTLPATPLWTHPNPAWLWNDFSWGDSEVYVAGYVNQPGASGSIFRTTTTTTGVDLQVPVLALPLEGGERPYCIFPYLNFEFIGTNLGIRMCRTISAYDPSGNAGDLEAGAIQPNIFQQVKGPVTAITAHNRFVYFAWQTFDTASSGLGRLDISNFVDELTPAYTSDVMVPTSGGLQGADWFYAPGEVLGVTGYNSPVVAMAYSGLWVNTPNEVVTSGYIDSGYVTYGIPDDKVALQLSARAEAPLDGTLLGFVSVDQRLSENYTQVGETFSAFPPRPWTLTQIRGSQYQVRIEMVSADTNQSPLFSRWLLKAYPAVVAGIQIITPITLHRVINEQGLEFPFDPYAEYVYLENLRESQQVIPYVEGPWSRTVVISTLDWVPYMEQGNAGDYRGYNSVLVVYMKSFPTTSA